MFHRFRFVFVLFEDLLTLLRAMRCIYLYFNYQGIFKISGSVIKK